ncbi:FAD-binding oxidoreductase [Fulvivirga maritima]|uniref:NAD(P)/FAD-dependent oxidoreductase n=1 Tax=Fulvivirga maritima TaxID=2904247 RepID=UPI001F373D11|nr:FAD-dependent oxidoreductase [Fulvivirga maritima]UII29302.1 FAD-binding oxidoreductase [Fulvivirga maritima]
MFSVWERQSFINYDYIIIGSGIVGLSTAISMKEKEPNANIAILERGLLPSGASTKNAGFACFGSLTELLQDIKTLGKERTYNLAQERYKGLLKLRARLGDEPIDYQNYGGYELIREEELPFLKEIDEVNSLLEPIFSSQPFLIDNKLIGQFGFNTSVVKSIIYSPFEGQIDTGKMMKALIGKAEQLGIIIHTGAEVEAYNETETGVEVTVKDKLYKEINFKADKVAICTNAFTKQLMPEAEIAPGRGIVLITKPISNLTIQGVFHMDQGFYYFRNFEDRIILGGARNLDIETETTTDQGINNKITENLTHTLKETILPDYQYEIDYFWSGIMAFGEHKEPLLTQVSDRVFAGFRLGGMGVAIGTQLGEKLANMMV